MISAAYGAALEIAHRGDRSPSELERSSDEQLASQIAVAAGISAGDAMTAVRDVRSYVDSVYQLGDDLRDGVFGSWPQNADRDAAARSLREKHPWLTESQSHQAIAKALAWTAY